MARQAVEFRRFRCQTQRRSGRLTDSSQGAVDEAWTDSARHALPDHEIVRSSVQDREPRSDPGPSAGLGRCAPVTAGGMTEIRRDRRLERFETKSFGRVEAEPGRR
jgi:hypothetical protein